MRNLIKKKINEEKNILLIEKSKNKEGDYSQMYYNGAIKLLEDFPINDNIIVWNNYIKEKRIESKRYIDSDYWLGVSEELDILSNIIINENLFV